MQEAQHMMTNLLESIDWDEAAEHSYRNFHAKGLHYLNLLRDPRFTVKLYMFQNPKHNSMGYLVWPHNHAYNFCHRTLVGKVFNHTFDIGRGSDWNMYSFETPLNGGRGLTKLLPCGLSKSHSTVYGPGEGYYLKHDEVHTISIEGDYAAAMLIQFHDIEPVTSMFALADEKPNCEDDLYFRMEAPQGRRLVEKFREELEGKNDDSVEPF